MKVFLVIGNKNIEQIIRSSKCFDVVDTEDSLENIYDLLEFENEMDYIIINNLICKEKMLINVAHRAYEKGIKIIVLIDNFDSEKNKKLIGALANEDVNAFIKIDSITEEKINEVINNYPPKFDFSILAPVKENVVKVKEVIKETIYKTKIQKQRILSFYTTDNSFLTADLITQIGVLLSQKVEQKILILDFNTLFPVVDHFLGINKNIDVESKYDIGDNTSLVAMYNAIERNILNSSNFSNFVKKHPKYKNIDVATGLYDLVLFEKMPNEYFERIIDTAVGIYDTILINTNPDISLGSTFIPITKATDIICVTEANYTEIRNLLFVINNLKSKMQQSKFKIAVSNVTNKGLDKETIKELFKDYDILSYIPYDEVKERSLNDQKPFISGLNKKKLEPYIKVLENLDYLPKTSFLGKVFKGNKNDKKSKEGEKALE